MIHLAGSARSGDCGHHPPPPVPSLSSSTLSPLAPPFTVDRWVPSVANPNNSLPPPTGATTPYFVPTGDSVWSSSSSGASRLSNLNSGLGPGEGTRYYPYYVPACDSVDGSMEKLSNYKAYTGGWSGAFDLEEGRPARGSVVNSSWMDSLTSCQMSLALKKRGTANSFGTYDDSFGSWHGAHNESSSTHGHVGSECSEWLDDSHRGIYVDKGRFPNDCSFDAETDTTAWPNEGSSYFYSPETTSIVKECDTFIPNSYDRYISQLISCSKDPVAHFPARTSSSIRKYVPLNERNASVLSSSVLKHGNSEINHANLHRKNNDYADYVIGMQNEGGIYENAECKEALEKMGKVANLSFCNASNVESGVFIPDDSIQTCQEMPDHLNVAVDSPCWKGASASRRYPFSSDEILQPLSNSVTSGSDDFVQGQMSLKNQSDIEQGVTFVCNENGKDIDCAEKESNPERADDAKKIEQDEHISVLNEQVCLPQGIDDHVRQLSRVENIYRKVSSNTFETIPTVQKSDFVFNHITTSPTCSSRSCANASNGEMNLSYPNAPSICLSQEHDARVLVKAMCSLSEVLLRHYCNDNEALEACDLKPVHQIIDNLEAVILRNKKVITGSSSHVPRVEETPVVKNSNAEVTSNKDLKDAKENKNAVSSGLNDDKHDDIAKSFTSNFKASDGMAQEEDDPKILLYKNLWVQTEATLCSLKHDVALMKLEMRSLKNHFKAKSQVSSDGLDCAASISVENQSRRDAQVDKNHKQKEDKIDSSVLQRLRILKCRDEVALSGSDEPTELNAVVDVNTIEKGVLQFKVASPKKKVTYEKLPAGVEEESHISASDGFVIQSYNPKSHGKMLFSSGNGSPSSEWEHVAKDEFLW